MPDHGLEMKEHDSDLVAYYSARAAEYEQIYEKPERQEDLATLRSMVREFTAGRRVLEIACGTGYWTAVIARFAESVVAKDPSRESVEIARSKNFPAGKVVIEIAETPQAANGIDEVTSVFSGFLWSHIPRQELTSWIEQLVGGVPSGSDFLFMDNRFVDGSSTPVADTDGDGNTFQMRQLSDGRTFRIIKNFPSSEELRRIVEPVARDIHITELEYYWLLTFKS